MFKNFPKIRSILPPEFQAIYAEQYKQNRDGGSTAAGLTQKMESWMHKRVAADLGPGSAGSTLEIGAGTLNHMAYERLSGQYDIVEPFKYLFESSPNLDRVRKIYEDIADIPGDVRYDRIISVATFEHICDLPNVIARCGLLLADGGNLRTGIPSEGTILWRLGYTFTTGLEFKRKHDLDYEVLMRHEHVNTAKEIEEVLRYFFLDVRGSVFGIVKALSFYQFYACRGPRLDRCSEYLATQSGATAGA